ncbi:MAG: hypothetical protein ACO3A2_04555 [Bdellovibrionia bacterium]
MNLIKLFKVSILKKYSAEKIQAILVQVGGVKLNLGLNFLTFLATSGTWVVQPAWASPPLLNLDEVCAVSECLEDLDLQGSDSLEEQDLDLNETYELLQDSKEESQVSESVPGPETRNLISVIICPEDIRRMKAEDRRASLERKCVISRLSRMGQLELVQKRSIDEQNAGPSVLSRASDSTLENVQVPERDQTPSPALLLSSLAGIKDSKERPMSPLSDSTPQEEDGRGSPWFAFLTQGKKNRIHPQPRLFESIPQGEWKPLRGQNVNFEEVSEDSPLSSVFRR